MNPQKPYRRIGMVARWRPVHLGHVPVLQGLCDRADQAFIRIGSANRYNARNPFTVDETVEMIHVVLEGRDNYTLIPIDDLDDGPRWRLMILDIFGPLDTFITANPYVASLMAGDYEVLHPITMVPQEARVPIDGTMVRQAMARGDDWRHLVPAEVAGYIETHGLDSRFRREFGLETLALGSVLDA